MRGMVRGMFWMMVCLATPAIADVLPPAVADAEQRLRANPKAYDRVDEFCAGKKPQAACVIPGSVFAGGGAGTCRNGINRGEGTIDLACVRNDEVAIDRRLPEGGFVSDERLCRAAEEEARAYNRPARRVNCKPIVPTPADRFCKGVAPGAACTVELNYQGRVERHEGVCKQITESEHFYYFGPQTAKREVIRCEPPQATTRTFKPVSWVKKLF